MTAAIAPEGTHGVKGGRGRPGLRIVVGLVIGILVGVIADAAIWIWAFGSALSGTQVSVPLIVSTHQAGGDISASSGPGVLLLPLVLALIGAVVALLIGIRRRRPAV